jgi:hypothetical protein
MNSQFSPADSQSLTTVVVKHFHLLIRKQAGWTVRQNIRLDYRWGDGKVETMRKYAAELVALLPDVILASSSLAIAPLLETTLAV